MTASSKALQRIPPIHYLVQFWEDQVHKIRALIDSDSEINVIPLAYMVQLSLITQKTGIGA